MFIILFKNARHSSGLFRTFCLFTFSTKRQNKKKWICEQTNFRKYIAKTSSNFHNYSRIECSLLLARNLSKLLVFWWFWTCLNHIIVVMTRRKNVRTWKWLPEKKRIKSQHALYYHLGARFARCEQRSRVCLVIIYLKQLVKIVNNSIYRMPLVYWPNKFDANITQRKRNRKIRALTVSNRVECC